METTQRSWVWEFTKDPEGNHHNALIYYNKEVILYEKPSHKCCSKANAQLIAAAPDLLEACKMVIDFSDDDNINRLIEIAIPKIEQAIAKAEGREE